MKFKLWAPAVVLALAGGIAYAVIPDNNGVIHGCYKKSNGDLRVIDDSVSTCKASEAPVNWSMIGPQGPPGPEGPQGPPGPASAASSTDSGLDPITLPATLVSLSLPAGSYVLSGKVIVGNLAADTSQLSCQLLNAGELGGPSNLDQSETYLFGGTSLPTPAGSIAGLPLVGSVNLTGEGNATVSIFCTANNAPTFAQFAHLYAIKVATLTQQ